MGKERHIRRKENIQGEKIAGQKKKDGEGKKGVNVRFTRVAEKEEKIHLFQKMSKQNTPAKMWLIYRIARF